MASSKASGRVVRRGRELVVYSHPLGVPFAIALGFGGMLTFLVAQHEAAARAVLRGALAALGAGGTSALLRYGLRTRIDVGDRERVRVSRRRSEAVARREDVSVVLRRSWPLSWQRDVAILSGDEALATIRGLSARAAARLRDELAVELAR